MKATHKHLFSLSEAERRIANLVMIGTVIDITIDGRARVQIGELQTAKLPWLSPRMGNRRDWHPPKGGEQVLVLCHNGDPAQGVIVASLGSAANPNPDSNPRLFKTVYADGTFVQIDLDTHEMSIGCAGNVSATVAGDLQAAVGGKAQVTAGGNIEASTAAALKASAASAEVTAPLIKLTGAVTIDGPLTVTGLTALQATTVLETALVPGGNSF
jgi:phage baseplate assembly protein V